MNQAAAALDIHQKEIFGHPRGLATLFFTEMWERFSYYGMRALLVLFMVEQIDAGGLGYSDQTATAIYGLYTGFAYLVCLPGGWIADRLWGAQRVGLGRRHHHHVRALRARGARSRHVLLGLDARVHGHRAAEAERERRRRRSLRARGCAPRRGLHDLLHGHQHRRRARPARVRRPRDAELALRLRGRRRRDARGPDPVSAHARGARQGRPRAGVAAVGAAARPPRGRWSAPCSR